MVVCGRGLGQARSLLPKLRRSQPIDPKALRDAAAWRSKGMRVPYNLPIWRVMVEVPPSPYLAPLDSAMEERVARRALVSYVRYMDDFVLLARTRW